MAKFMTSVGAFDGGVSAPTRSGTRLVRQRSSARTSQMLNRIFIAQVSVVMVNLVEFTKFAIFSETPQAEKSGAIWPDRRSAFQVGHGSDPGNFIEMAVEREHHRPDAHGA